MTLIWGYLKSIHMLNMPKETQCQVLFPYNNPQITIRVSKEESFKMKGVSERKSLPSQDTEWYGSIDHFRLPRIGSYDHS